LRLIVAFVAEMGCAKLVQGLVDAKESLPWRIARSYAKLPAHRLGLLDWGGDGCHALRAFAGLVQTQSTAGVRIQTTRRLLFFNLSASDGQLVVDGDGRSNGVMAGPVLFPLHVILVVGRKTAG
jgi:hypothetical protein